MKQKCRWMILCCAVWIGWNVEAQALELPRLSPKAMVMQRVGITDVTVSYYSPAARGRIVWGELVPFGKVWRTGANGATTITFNRDVAFGKNFIEAGTYSIFTVPGQKSWKIAINSVYKTSGTRDYDPKNNLAEVNVTPQVAPHRERLTFLITKTTNKGANLVLEWAGVRVVIPFRVQTELQVMNGIDKALSRTWRPYYRAARYLLASKGDMVTAEQYMTQSIKLKKSWWNHWYMALIQEQLAKPKAAVAFASKAQKLGAKDRIFKKFFQKRVEKHLAKWQKAIEASKSVKKTAEAKPAKKAEEAKSAKTAPKKAAASAPASRPAMR